MKFDIIYGAIHDTVPPGKYAVTSYGSNWYLLNKETMVGKKIGKFMAKKQNYFYVAMDMAKERNHGTGL